LPDSGFPRSARIVKTDDFSSVFNFRKRISGQFITLHYQYNQHSGSRLGLIVGKRTARLSVQRNYMKRILREMFRRYRADLPNLDIVIRAQKLYVPSQFPLVEHEFQELMLRLHRQTQPRVTPTVS
jgi:ribonuclease P protein component